MKNALREGGRDDVIATNICSISYTIITYVGTNLNHWKIDFVNVCYLLTNYTISEWSLSRNIYIFNFPNCTAQLTSGASIYMIQVRNHLGLYQIFIHMHPNYYPKFWDAPLINPPPLLWNVAAHLVIDWLLA